MGKGRATSCAGGATTVLKILGGHCILDHLSFRDCHYPAGAGAACGCFFFIFKCYINSMEKQSKWICVIH